MDGCGTGGIGFIVGSRAKGFEEGDHTYYTNSTLNAGQTLTLQSGQDTTLKGAQAQGDKVIAKVGGDLHLESQQAIDDYTSKQSSESAGGSVNVMGTPGGSANISFSRDKMDSKYRSVEEQTGLFAGNQGFDISVGKHTQLDGAVISSKADAKNNQLDTGTLGFSDIHNYAEYKVEHQSGGVSTSGGVEGNMLANMGHALAMAGNHSDSTENTTQSAVSQGTWTIRDSDNQQQDIAQLSQDTDNAHSTLTKIFDKEKEQNRQQKQQLVGEIGAQIIDLATTVDTIRGTNITKEESTLNRLSDTAYDDIYQALSETKDNVTERDIQNYLFQQRLQDYTNQSGFGTGGKYTRAIQAVTAFTQGMMGNNIVTAIANGSAPYLANEVKNQIQGNSVESDIQRTLAHGLVNAGLALAKGENAAAQATGAMTGETVGILSHSFYGKTPEELTETEKQNISAWATLASGIAGGLISDNSAGVANAAQAGKVVVENNLLGGNELTHTQLAQEYGKDRMSCAENPNSESCQRGKALQQAYIYALATGSTGSVSLLSTSARVMWFIGAGANSSVQYIDSKKVNPVNAIIAGWVNVMTMGEGWKSTVFFNAGGGALTNTINDESAAMGAITTGGGALIGYGLGNFMVKPITNWVGKIITKGNNPGFNEVLRKYSESEVKGNTYIMKEVSESKIPSGAGNIGGSGAAEVSASYMQDIINKTEE